MSEEQKEEAMPEQQQIQRVRRISLVRVGNRSVSVHGYRNDGVEEHLKWHLGQPLSNRWCKVSCMAKTFFRQNTVTSRKGVRKRIARTFHVLLERGMFLVVEYDPSAHGEITAVKLFEADHGLEQQLSAAQLDRMRKRLRLTEELWLKAMALIGCAQVGK